MLSMDDVSIVFMGGNISFNRSRFISSTLQTRFSTSTDFHMKSFRLRLFGLFGMVLCELFILNCLFFQASVKKVLDVLFVVDMNLLTSLLVLSSVGGISKLARVLTEFDWGLFTLLFLRDRAKEYNLRFIFGGLGIGFDVIGLLGNTYLTDGVLGYLVRPKNYFCILD